MGSNDKVESYRGYVLLNSTILHTIHIRYMYVVTGAQKDRHSVSVTLAEVFKSFIPCCHCRIRFALCPVLLLYLETRTRRSIRHTIRPAL